MVRRLWGRGGTWKTEGTSKLIQIGVISNCGVWPIVGGGGVKKLVNQDEQHKKRKKEGNRKREERN